MADTKKITPFLWFDKDAGEAAKLYQSVFARTRVVEESRWGAGSPYPEGSVMSVTLEIEGQRLMLFNGGPAYKLTPAFSLSVSCEDQAEVDRIWNGLLKGGGKPTQCGWLDDPFGVSWQIVPKILPRLLADPDRGRAARAMAAMMKMVKLDVAELERAANG
jgi:predicted 3-demethylubiquinone-9 3-methyltransferase (glyoxalase superfamily)